MADAASNKEWQRQGVIRAVARRTSAQPLARNEPYGCGLPLAGAMPQQKGGLETELGSHDKNKGTIGFLQRLPRVDSFVPFLSNQERYPPEAAQVGEKNQETLNRYRFRNAH